MWIRTMLVLGLLMVAEVRAVLFGELQKQA
jgi:hypothetical protein